MIPGYVIVVHLKSTELFCEVLSISSYQLSHKVKHSDMSDEARVSVLPNLVSSLLLPLSIHILQFLNTRF